MARYVIDAPTLLHLVDRGISTPHQLVAPGYIRSEALQLLLDDVRSGAREERAALATHTAVTEVKLRLLSDRVSRATAWSIAREQGWSTLRDAEHLALVRLQADALVTVDKGFAKRASKLVDLAPLRALTRP